MVQVHLLLAGFVGNNIAVMARVAHHKRWSQHCARNAKNFRAQGRGEVLHVGGQFAYRALGCLAPGLAALSTLLMVTVQSLPMTPAEPQDGIVCTRRAECLLGFCLAGGLALSGAGFEHTGPVKTALNGGRYGLGKIGISSGGIDRKRQYHSAFAAALTALAATATSSRQTEKVSRMAISFHSP